MELECFSETLAFCGTIWIEFGAQYFVHSLSLSFWQLHFFSSLCRYNNFDSYFFLFCWIFEFVEFHWRKNEEFSGVMMLIRFFIVVFYSNFDHIFFVIDFFSACCLFIFLTKSIFFFIFRNPEKQTELRIDLWIDRSYLKYLLFFWTFFNNSRSLEWQWLLLLDHHGHREFFFERNFSFFFCLSFSWSTWFTICSCVDHNQRIDQVFSYLSLFLSFNSWPFFRRWPSTLRSKTIITNKMNYYSCCCCCCFSVLFAWIV